MKRFITLQVISFPLLMFFVFLAHAMPPAPPGPYLSIEDELVTPGPVQNPSLGIDRNSQNRIYPPPGKYNDRPRPEHRYPAARQGYLPEHEQPLIPWPKPNPASNNPYPGGYQAYPQGMSR